MKNRTRNGSVTASARKKYGDKDEMFPIFDRESARSALRLRGHAHSKAQRRSAINRARKYLPALAKAAYERDKRLGKI